MKKNSQFLDKVMSKNIICLTMKIINKTDLGKKKSGRNSKKKAQH